MRAENCFVVVSCSCVNNETRDIEFGQNINRRKVLKYEMNKKKTFKVFQGKSISTENFYQPKRMLIIRNLFFCLN